MKSLSPAARIVKQILLTLLFGFAISGTFIVIEVLRYPHYPIENVRRMVVLSVFYSLSMTMFNLTLFPIIGRWHRRKELSISLIVQAFSIFLLAAILTVWIGGHLTLFIYPDFNVLHPQQYITASLYTMVIGIPVFLYLVVRDLWKKALQKVREKELAEERLEKELLAARLQALQAQTNPHFLYNALNSIAALIATDPAGAETAVERLASLFRYAMESHDGRSAALAEEIGVIEDYLAIEKIRFGERMQLQIAIDPSLLECRIPPLLLQPLVENAIKHGVSQREDPTAIEIKAEAEGEKLRFIVRNQGLPPAWEDSRGVGLRNMRSRCQTLFGENHTFRLFEAAPGWIEAELVIPWGPPAKQFEVTYPEEKQHE
jgi:hypothetical protein